MFPRASSLIRAIEINTRLTTNPRFSVILLAAQKARILFVYVGRTLIEAILLIKAHQHTKKVKNTCSPKDALIIAGGPSVNRLNVQKVIDAQARGELNVFAMNWYPLSELAKQLKPDFFCLSDPINKPGSQKVFKGNKTQIIWDYLKYSPKTKLILPHSWLNCSKAISNDVSIWIDDRELVGWSRSISPVKPRGYASLTAHKTISAALYLGHKTVFLIGLDNSVFKNVVVTEKNELIDKPSHFYDSQNTLDLKHGTAFHYGMQDYLYNHSLVFLDLNKCFHGYSILNLDCHSHTDVFPKLANEFID